MNIKIKRTIVRIFDKSIKVSNFFRFMVILSALYGLIYTIYNFFAFIFKDKVINFLTSNTSDSFYFYKENLLFFFTANRLLYLICFIAGIFILYGCYLLFRGYKWGLLFYTIAKIFQVFTPIFFLGNRAIAIGDIMIIILFLIYYYQYSFTHNIDKQDRKYNQIQD